MVAGRMTAPGAMVRGIAEEFSYLTRTVTTTHHLLYLSYRIWHRTSMPRVLEVVGSMLYPSRDRRQPMTNAAERFDFAKKGAVTDDVQQFRCG
jgi:hypothetical protein